MKSKKKKQSHGKYFDNSSKFKPMAMVAALKKKFPELRSDGVEYSGNIEGDELGNTCSDPRAIANQNKFVDSVLGAFVVSELGDESRMSYVNEAIKLFKLSS